MHNFWKNVWAARKGLWCCWFLAKLAINLKKRIAHFFTIRPKLRYQNHSLKINKIYKKNILQFFWCFDIFLPKKDSTTCHHIKRWIIMYDCEQHWSKFWSPKVNRQFAEYHIKKTRIKWKKFTPNFEAKCHFWASTIPMVPTVKLKENKNILPLG